MDETLEKKEKEEKDEKTFMDHMLDYKLLGIKRVCSEIKNEQTVAQLIKSRDEKSDDMHEALGLGASIKKKARSAALANLVGFYSIDSNQEAMKIADLDIPAAYKVYISYLIKSQG